MDGWVQQEVWMGGILFIPSPVNKRIREPIYVVWSTTGMRRTVGTREVQGIPLIALPPNLPLSLRGTTSVGLVVKQALHDTKPMIRSGFNVDQNWSLNR